MIDLTSETLIPLKDLAKSIPGRNGRPPAITTVGRWATRGVKGVVLDTVMIGGQRYSSMDAFRRFVAAGNPKKAEVTKHSVINQLSNQLLEQAGW